MSIELPRRIFRRTQEPLAADVSLIASEFLAGFQLIQRIDRPAVSIFGSARVVEGSPVYERAQLPRRFSVAGPAIIEEPSTTTVVQHGQRVTVDESGNLVITAAAGNA